ncbi:ribosome assembly protein SQT1 [Paracoccidioides lutzii Pb01]|uniref:Ribosome assembly protein SQT1 n=1 Tax=Paracoccidioides lutzii (strain ATCC MYA-826 / Pb01) TaxID=502779 RepID=C1H1V0_PARBA|nr:ribosome assembly protein SQT1 [Paracoccidioides lutzii Pb01]EEH33837.1 ribosome assembly protein SQT1 [Paracoccidioides lutzii Pb01]
MSHPPPLHPNEDLDHENEDEVFLDAGDAAEEISADDDQPMDDLDDDDYGGEEMAFQNDSSAHFDHHTDSIYSIAQHPIHTFIIITGSGDHTAYIFNSASQRPLLPKSYESNPQPRGERESLSIIAKLGGHTDSVNAVAFTEPLGQYVVTAGLDGRLRAWQDMTPGKIALSWKFLAEVQEVEEINWVATCPSTRSRADEEKKNLIALGASNGSVWVYRIDELGETAPISMVSCFFHHKKSCTAGKWTPDGKLLATVSEDGSFYVYDVFGAAAAAGVASSTGTQVVVGLTAQDQRFAVEGGLFSIAIAPTGAFAAVGGAGGHIKVVGLPRLPSSTTKRAASVPTTGGSAGTLLASLQAQTDSVETLSFSSPPLMLLAAGSVDGSIALFDTANRFALRRHVRSAHEDAAVVQVEFVRDETPSTQRSVFGTIGGNNRSFLLTSVGMDGVVRRWDARGSTLGSLYGLVKEWRGHLGMTENEEGEQSEGILGFVQGGEGCKRIVTAGDDGVALVFEE